MNGHPSLVCTVLPTYNERDNIGSLVLRLLAANRAPYMVLVVDDDSPDGTWQVVEDLVQATGGSAPGPAGQSSSGASPGGQWGERERVRSQTDGKGVVLIRRTDEKGLTSAIQRGVDEAVSTYGAGIVTWMDCDLSMPPEDVPRLVRAIVDEGADVAIGSRWIPGGADVAHGTMARSLSWIINHYAMLMLGRGIHDYTSGFIAARAEVLQRIRLRGDYGEYCIDLLGRAAALGYRLQEVPYVCVPRTSGDSKTGANLWDYLSKGRKYVTTVWNVRRDERGALKA